MVKIDRGFVLKTFLDRIVEAKRLNMSDIRMSVKELDDVAYFAEAEGLSAHARSVTIRTEENL